jgi:hypothetical protein
MKTTLDVLQRCQDVGAPLVSCECPDPLAFAKAVGVWFSESPVLQWDFVEGVRKLNALGESKLDAWPTDGGKRCAMDPLGALAGMYRCSTNTVLVLQGLHKFFGEPAIVQQLANLRDVLKQNNRMVVIVGKALSVPQELRGDFVALDVPLPSQSELRSVLGDLAASYGLEEELGTLPDLLLGLEGFQAEQIAAITMTTEGWDFEKAKEMKLRQIELSGSLKPIREQVLFDDLGGCEQIKQFCRGIMCGKDAPSVLVFVDEIEKTLAGISGDATGVTQDQLGSLLGYMQDRDCLGMVFLGPPGAAKSAMAKAYCHEAGIPGLQLDLGAAKGSLVGQSEAQIRESLKIISALGERSLWIATSNNLAALPPELLRRFTLGKFFFDLPTLDERYGIWEIYIRKYGLDSHQPGSFDFDDTDWTGAEIKQACSLAWRLNLTLEEAARYVVPVAVSAQEQIERLRRSADRRYLSASHGGLYRAPELAVAGNGRGVKLN